MKSFKTEIRAISPATGELAVFDGPPIIADTKEEAEEAVERLFPYAKVAEETELEDCL